MLTQIFRNKIYESRPFKNAIRELDRFIANNKSLREDQIVSGLTHKWTQQGKFSLGDFKIAGKRYGVTAEFLIEKTHGFPYLAVDDSVTLSSKNINFPTEFGDLAIIVDYWLDNRSISRRLSIIQSKKELCWRGENTITPTLFNGFLA
jgi:hypothetical protein